MRPFYTCVSFALVLFWLGVLFFFKQKTAYELRISDWSSDVCSPDLAARLMDGRFTLDDFLDQMQQLKKMGPLSGLLNRRGFEAAATAALRRRERTSVV